MYSRFKKSCLITLLNGTQKLLLIFSLLLKSLAEAFAAPPSLLHFGWGIRLTSSLVSQFQPSCIYTLHRPPSYLRTYVISKFFALFLFSSSSHRWSSNLYLVLALPYLELIDNCSAHFLSWLSYLGMCGMVPPSGLGRTHLIWSWLTTAPPIPFPYMAFLMPFLAFHMFSSFSRVLKFCLLYTSDAADE